MKRLDRRTKILLSILFPVLLVVWNLGFDMGAFGTVFYRNVMTAWVFAVATFVALAYLKWYRKTDIKLRSFLILLIPISWPLIDYIDQHVPNIYVHYFIIFDYLVMMLALGYSAYVFLTLIKYDLFEPLKIRHKIFIVIATIVFSFAGYWVGNHHYLFLSCGHFIISGEYIPPNCYEPITEHQKEFRLYRRNY